MVDKSRHLTRTPWSSGSNSRPRPSCRRWLTPSRIIYQKAKLDEDPHWYEKNILGSGPFKFVAYETGQSIRGVRNSEYYHPGLPYLDGFTGIFAAKQATRVEAIRGDRAAMEFRGLPPSARDRIEGGARRQARGTGERLELRQRGLAQSPEEAVRRCPGAAGTVSWRRPVARRRGVIQDRQCADRRWHRLPRLAAGAPRRNWRRSPAIWPDIEKSRAEAKRLLKEAGAGGPELRDDEPRRRPAI